MKSSLVQQLFTASTACFVLLGAGLFAVRAQTQKGSMPEFGLVIHGGAGTILRKEMTPAQQAEYRAALRQALDAGYTVLEKNGSSLDAVIAAITLMEDSPLFNAGKGAVLTSAGVAELDAAVMDGRTLGAGAVTGVKRIKNPILLARAVMENSPHVLFAGEGAEAFAKTQGFKFVPNSYFITERRRKELERAKEAEKKKTALNLNHLEFVHELDGHSLGTVGAVALDRQGNLAAGTSTGGRTNKKPGRVGDTPIPGAGTYANNRTCAVSGTGHGEYFMRTVAAHEVSALMEHRGWDLSRAAEEVVRQIGALGGTGGLIAIDRQGHVALPFNTPGMYRAIHLSDAEPVVDLFENK